MGEGLVGSSIEKPELRSMLTKRRFHSHINVGEAGSHIHDDIQPSMGGDYSEPGHKTSRVDNVSNALSKVTATGVGLSNRNEESMLSKVEFEQYNFSPVKLGAIAE
eukprot:CAMPEP_0170510828 /NCGR_PEP_ID=MMETSP0208-20121228/65976_1 /TAXON_ID=197538 /ORGANISM="Strombidium inclinatum, Strain S3" /LENGTH=105 /DNA_ID=CAMNT_0010794317 /DNA_START=9 /DNA_END=326 /DNA_ORIENTATION=-